MAVTTMPGAVEKGNFRTCPVTGLKVDLAAEKLIQANAVAAVVFILIGGFFALLLALTRWQAIHLLPADWFYRALTAHGFDMLVAWIVFFEVAGLKAGHASDTWPLMFGYLIPPGLLTMAGTWWRSLLEVGTVVHFTHRWFAWAVLIVSVLLYFVARREHYSSTINRGLVWLIVLIALQIVLGISVIWFHVPIVLALSHQAAALLLFVVALFLNHRILSESAQEIDPGLVASMEATG